MAGTDPRKVLVGAPDQSGVSGAILSAPLGTALPTGTAGAINVAFVGGGYVSKEGVKVTPELSTTDIQDWNGDVVRTLLEAFKGTVEFALIQYDGAGATMVFGAGNVTITAATSSKGEEVAVALGADLPPARSWVFKMKDGDALIRIVLPNAQVTKWTELSFMKTSPIALGCTLSCYPDSSGKSIYIYTNDGVKSA